MCACASSRPVCIGSISCPLITISTAVHKISVKIRLTFERRDWFQYKVYILTFFFISWQLYVILLVINMHCVKHNVNTIIIIIIFTIKYCKNMLTITISRLLIKIHANIYR